MVYLFIYLFVFLFAYLFLCSETKGCGINNDRIEISSLSDIFHSGKSFYWFKVYTLNEEMQKGTRLQHKLVFVIGKNGV